MRTSRRLECTPEEPCNTRSTAPRCLEKTPSISASPSSRCPLYAWLDVSPTSPPTPQAYRFRTLNHTTGTPVFFDSGHSAPHIAIICAKRRNIQISVRNRYAHINALMNPQSRNPHESGTANPADDWRTYNSDVQYRLTPRFHIETGMMRLLNETPMLDTAWHRRFTIAFVRRIPNYRDAILLN